MEDMLRDMGDMLNREVWRICCIERYGGYAA
jgi:hypothetical protein